MKGALRWILIIVGLLIAVGAATVILPALRDSASGEGGPLLETSNEPLTINLGGFLLGEELEKVDLLKDNVDGKTLDPMVMAGAMVGMLVVGVAGFAVFLIVLMQFLDTRVSGVKNDEDYQEAANNLEQREKADNKALRESQPPTPMPNHQRPRWDAFSTAVVILMFAALTGVAVLQTLRPDLTVEIAGTLLPAAIPVMLLIMLVTGVILIFTLKPKRLAAVDETDYEPVNWSAIWVALSGLILIGVGTGMVIAIRSMGG